MNCELKNPERTCRETDQAETKRKSKDWIVYILECRGGWLYVGMDHPLLPPGIRHIHETSGQIVTVEFGQQNSETKVLEAVNKMLDVVGGAVGP